MITETIKPTIEAELSFDDSGKPRIIKRSRKHYLIRLRTTNTPPSTYAVTYLLHESYPNPLREVRDKDADFPLETTSYGDYTVTAKVRHPEGVDIVTVDLARSLYEKYKNSNDPDIQQALKDIQTN